MEGAQTVYDSIKWTGMMSAQKYWHDSNLFALKMSVEKEEEEKWQG